MEKTRIFCVKMDGEGKDEDGSGGIQYSLACGDTGVGR